MHISVLSKHLPSIITLSGYSADHCVFDLVHLVESARYHLFNMESITHGERKPPENFKTGVDLKGMALVQQWSVMASWIEFESLLSCSKRLIDRAWVCLADCIKGDAKNLRTLGAAIYNLDERLKNKKKLKYIYSLPYFKILKEAWFSWGAELASTRNYVEHVASMGGRSLGWIQTYPDNKKWEIKSLIPDEVSLKGKDIKKTKFSFKRQRLAVDYARKIVSELDDLVTKLLQNSSNLLSPLIQFQGALSCFGTNNSIKEQLFDAYVSHLMAINPDLLDHTIQEEFKALRTALRGSHSIEYYSIDQLPIGKMTDNEAKNYKEKIKKLHDLISACGVWDRE
ncbi:MAG: hypothetical protein JRF62_06030 [Deltaproteobacteria bacterium]|nr:hypothetical protein [Deltaproteobacteria bacterium]